MRVIQPLSCYDFDEPGKRFLKRIADGSVKVVTPALAD